ncbi:MAG: GIY-YIG nuclease family protein [Parcubacteria group bacterium]|nr:GIY-YIG nuclease family protein [Parcubacteria group bacterium]
MYTVYILLCGDNTLYTGITTDIERRFQEHQEGKGSKYTRARQAVEIVYCKKYRDKSKASKREAEIKRLTREEKNDLINQR